MLSPLLFALAIGTAPEPATVAQFTFHDAARHAGRSILSFRPVELGMTPVRPISFATAPGAGTQYGLIPLGPDRATALTIAWDAKAPDGPRLWLDANNDGQLSAAESHRVNGKEIELVVDLMVPSANGPTPFRRTLIVRPAPLTGGLYYAVRGYAVGSLNMGGKNYRALLTDGNADGCFHGAGSDRIWLDLDGDGIFDPLTEQFPLGSPITAMGRVYIVKSDWAASQVQVFPRTTARGSARLTLFGKRDRPVSNLEAQLISDIGELVTIHDLTRPAGLPAGKYRIASLHFQMTDATGREWKYRFAGDGGYALTVDPENEAVLALLPGLTLKANVSPTDPVHAEQRLSVTPTIDNPLGLFLADCTVQKVVRVENCTADIRFVSPQGKIADRATSGFN